MALVLTSCRSGPSDDELDRLLAEATAANAAAKQQALDDAVSSGEPGFALTVSGQIGAPAGTLDWAALQKMATARVDTLNIQNMSKKTPTRFRGVLARDLLDRYAASPEATEATVVAIDGFRSTFQLADARAHRIVLALEADELPIPRSSGGPIFLVFPISESNELRRRYPDRFWSFYVTHLIVGTEAPRLRVGGTVLDGAALAKLPASTLDGRVGWKVEWPATAVHLRGVRLVDAIAAAGLTVPPKGRLVVRGKAVLHRDPKKPVTITAEDLDRCNPLLALEWGPAEKPITARLGGPIALAPACDRASEKLWMSFVEEIDVEKPAVDKP
jgi:hypothetical protein